MATLQVNGTELFYDDAGPLSEGSTPGPTIVLLHGVWMSSRFFKHQIQALQAHHRVVALDFRGHGYSAAVGSGHTVPQYARDLRGLLEHLGLNGAKSVVLVGWSMGAFVIWDYIAQFGNDGLAGSVVVDESASDYKWPDWPLGFADFEGLRHFMEALQGDQEATARGFIPMMFLNEPSAADTSWMLAEIMKLSPAVAGAILFDQTTRDYRPVLAQITGPTLLCFGADEKLVSLAAGEHLRENLPSAELVVFEHSSHCPFLEEPDAFNDAVLRFVRGLTRRSAGA